MNAEPLAITTDEDIQRSIDSLTDALTDTLTVIPADHETLREKISTALSRCLRPTLTEVSTRLDRAERLIHIGQLCAGVAHELRNPLSVIETSLYLLGERLGDDITARRYINRISAQVDISRETVNDLLDATRQTKLHYATVDLTAIVREAIAWVPRDPDVTVTLNLGDGPVPLSADARKLRQVLINLVSNALEAMRSRPERPVLAVSLGERPGWMDLTVEDTGIGIPPEALPRLFEPLYSTRHDGVGLGLALCRDIVEAHGGTLTAQSVSPRGARFTVSLPTTVPKPERDEQTKP